jgi:hypothetical protein
LLDEVPFLEELGFSYSHLSLGYTHPPQIGG